MCQHQPLSQTPAIPIPSVPEPCNTFPYCSLNCFLRRRKNERGRAKDHKTTKTANNARINNPALTLTEAAPDLFTTFLSSTTVPYLPGLGLYGPALPLADVIPPLTKLLLVPTPVPVPPVFVTYGGKPVPVPTPVPVPVPVPTIEVLFMKG